jgi:PAS domain S-box-containing protein
MAASYDGIAVLDRTGLFLDVNAAWARMTGIARETWLGRDIETMQRMPGVPRQSATRQALATKRPASTLVNVRGGELVLITASPHVAPDAAVAYVILNMRNITQLNALKYLLERERGATRLAGLREDRRGKLTTQLQEAGLGEFVFESPVMEELLATVAEVASYDSTVLLYGETGTGKGLLARLLHHLSNRAEKPFVEVNCGALPETLVESELFGHEPGAFTGALAKGKRGVFEQANGGTIFLDEVGEIPLASQAKLLKVLDDKEVRPLGGGAVRKLDLRVVCATNRDLHALVAAGKFREDLLYRIEVVPLTLPSLRDRPEDMKAMLYAFLDHFNRKLGRNKVVSLEVVAALLRYPLPGNVRELRNLVERLVMTSSGPEIGVESLPPAIRALASGPEAIAARDALVEESLTGAVDYRARLERLERQMLSHFSRTSRSTYEIARRTGLTQSAVVRKLKKYGFSAAGSRDGDGEVRDG